MGAGKVVNLTDNLKELFNTAGEQGGIDGI